MAERVDTAPPLAPASWYYFGAVAELARGPRHYELPGQRRFVGFLDGAGQPVVLAGRCAHMGADLARGCVRNGRLACPLHGWEFGADGLCARIPAAETEPIPSFARQTRYPAVSRGGHVFFHSEPHARFPAPFFDGVAPAELVAAAPFDLHDEVPWYFIGANAFDLQHFRNAHDRVLLGEPVVDVPHPFARRIQLQLAVAGDSFSDRLTRIVAGPQVTMTVTVWAGTLLFVTARFRRTTSYGLMTVRPVGGNATHARVIVWVRRSAGALARRSWDPFNAALRRRFIRQFLRADLGRMTGARFVPGRTIAADKPIAEYMEWVRQLHP